MSSRLARLIVVVACALATIAGPAAGAAQAHAAVVGVEPADGSTLTTAPAAVRLTFTENVLVGTAQLRVTGPGGQVTTPLDTAGRVVTGSLPAGLPDGAYTVLWRVTSADGHPISGSYAFVLNATGAAPSAVAAQSAVASPSASGPGTADPLDPASAATGLGTGAKIVIAVGAVLAGLAAVGGVWARSRRRQP